MRLRWLPHWWRSHEIKDASAERMAAAEDHAAAVQQRMETEMESVEAAASARQLRRELDQNGWSDLLRQAWGGAT